MSITTASLLFVEGKASGEEKPVTGVMHKFLEYMQSLKPFISSEQKMKDPKNADQISKNLKGLVDSVKTSKHEPQLSQPMLRISRDVLEAHIVEMQRVFQSGNKTYARLMLQSTLSVCMSCHTQLQRFLKTLLI
jgi:hypothetical protein